MKIFALTCGQKGANCEIFAKEALNAAEELGAEVEFCRMLDLNIHTCNICWPCPVIMKGAEACIHKDDAAWLYNKIMDCDGFLLAAPCYSLTPPGMLLTIRDRILGPRADVASNWESKQNKGVDKKFEFGEQYIDDRLFRRKVGAMISVGGATTEHWVSLCLASMQTLMFSAQFNIADQMNVLGISDGGAACFYPDLLERARQLGRNMVKSFEADVPYEINDAPDHKNPYFGEEHICPMCHQGLMMLYPGTDKVSCAVCGIDGTIDVVDGKVEVTFTEEQKSHSRHLYQGLKDHNDEVMAVSDEFAPNRPFIKEKVAAYKPWDEKYMVKPPRN